MNNIGHVVIRSLGIFLFLFGGNNARVAIKEPDDSCSISVNGGLAEPQPLILSPDPRSHGAFIYPPEPGSGSLVAEVGESFRLACPGSQLALDTIDPYDEILVTCAGNNKFILEGTEIEDSSFDEISCEKYPEYVAKKTGKCDGGSKVEIGFPIPSKTPKKKKREEFYSIIDLCHDENLGTTIWAHAKIVAEIDAFQHKFPRPTFRQGQFFRGFDVSVQYQKKTQRATIGRILNSPRLASEYIQNSGPSYLARGHLIAKADLIFGSHQRTTFYYVNVVPMWQNINEGNWLTMEDNVRVFASERNMDLDVWAGGYGILSLKDEKGNEQEIFLHVDEKKGRSSVPVPKILFKVVYNYPSRSGVVFLTANNPFLTKLTNEYRICKDVSKKIKYINWNLKRPDQGLSYCCEIDDFRKAVPNIPDFETEHLLV